MNNTTEPGTPERDALTYGIDMGGPNGDYTALTIKKGDTAYTFVGAEAKAITELLAAERAAYRQALREKLIKSSRHDTDVTLEADALDPWAVPVVIVQQLLAAEDEGK